MEVEKKFLLFFPGLFPQGKARVLYVVLAAVGKNFHSFL